MLWNKFNDQLALVGVVIIIGIWVANKWLSIPKEAIGATIVIFTLIFNYYFRKSPPAGGQ